LVLDAPEGERPSQKKAGQMRVVDETNTVRMEATIANLSAEIERLRAAIQKHHDDTWGEDEVGHPNDAELYAALEPSK
jgi:uncharacterized small protein (DUF1192 family)